MLVPGRVLVLLLVEGRIRRRGSKFFFLNNISFFFSCFFSYVGFGWELRWVWCLPYLPCLSYLTQGVL